MPSPPTNPKQTTASDPKPTSTPAKTPRRGTAELLAEPAIQEFLTLLGANVVVASNAQFVTAGFARRLYGPLPRTELLARSKDDLGLIAQDAPDSGLRTLTVKLPGKTDPTGLGPCWLGSADESVRLPDPVATGAEPTAKKLARPPFAPPPPAKEPAPKRVVAVPLPGIPSGGAAEASVAPTDAKLFYATNRADWVEREARRQASGQSRALERQVLATQAFFLLRGSNQDLDELESGWVPVLDGRTLPFPQAVLRGYRFREGWDYSYLPPFESLTWRLERTKGDADQIAVAVDTPAVVKGNAHEPLIRDLEKECRARKVRAFLLLSLVPLKEEESR